MNPIGIISRTIVRLDDELLRCLAWCAWYPVVFLDLALFIAPMRAWFTARFWEIAGAGFVAGLDGVKP